MSDQDGNELRPLEEKDLGPEAMVIFFVILIPALACYCGITWYCKCMRAKRKALEQAERKEKYAPKDGETIPTEANLVLQKTDAQPDGDWDKELQMTKLDKDTDRNDKDDLPVDL